MKNKVYCSECKFYTVTKYGMEKCINENLAKIDTYRAKDVNIFVHPSLVNTHNNCEFFEKKHNFDIINELEVEKCMSKTVRKQNCGVFYREIIFIIIIAITAIIVGIVS